MPFLGKSRDRDLPYDWYWKGEPLSRLRREREPIMPVYAGQRRRPVCGDYAPRPWLGRLSLASILPTRGQRVSARPLGQIGPGFFSGENLLESCGGTRRPRRPVYPFEPWEAPFTGHEPPPRGPHPVHPWGGTSSYSPRPPFDHGSGYTPRRYRSPRSPRSPCVWSPDEQDDCDCCDGCEDASEYEGECLSDGEESCLSDEMRSMGGGSYHRRRPDFDHLPSQTIRPFGDVPLDGRAYAGDFSPRRPFSHRGESRVSRRVHYGDDIGLRRF